MHYAPTAEAAVNQVLRAVRHQQLKSKTNNRAGVEMNPGNPLRAPGSAAEQAAQPGRRSGRHPGSLSERIAVNPRDAPIRPHKAAMGANFFYSLSTKGWPLCTSPTWSRGKVNRLAMLHPSSPDPG